MRKDVLEEATNELLGGDGATLKLVSGGVFVSESDLAIMQLAEAVVTEGDAKDVGSEILEGRLPEPEGGRALIRALDSPDVSSGAKA